MITISPPNVREATALLRMINFSLIESFPMLVGPV